jgi:hypothetical protein
VTLNLKGGRMATKSKSKPKSNFSKLKSAGIIPAKNDLSDDDKALLAKLSAAEVKALISTKAKLGDDFIKRNARPSMDYAF